MFYYLYEIRNNLNGKIYIGVHRTKSLDDGYMGSGKVLSDAIRKYGIENFTKTILEKFDNSTAMYAKEKEVVTDEFLLREDVYNLRRGGTGGFDYINNNGLGGFAGRNHTEESKKKQGHVPTEDERKAASVRAIGNNYNPNIKLTGENHPAAGEKSLSHINSISNSIQELYNSGHYEQFRNTSPLYQTGKNHPQFGKMWITNGTDSKKIHKTDPIQEGWRKGRVM